MAREHGAMTHLPYASRSHAVRAARTGHPAAHPPRQLHRGKPESLASGWRCLRLITLMASNCTGAITDKALPIRCQAGVRWQSDGHRTGSWFPVEHRLASGSHSGRQSPGSWPVSVKRPLKLMRTSARMRVRPGVLCQVLISRAWPARAYIFASFSVKLVLSDS